MPAESSRRRCFGRLGLDSEQTAGLALGVSYATTSVIGHRPVKRALTGLVMKSSLTCRLRVGRLYGRTTGPRGRREGGILLPSSCGGKFPWNRLAGRAP